MQDCDFLTSEFEFQQCYYVHFLNNKLEKSVNLFILPDMGYISPLLFFYEDGFGIEYPTQVDML